MTKLRWRCNQFGFRISLQFVLCPFLSAVAIMIISSIPLSLQSCAFVFIWFNLFSNETRLQIFFFWTDLHSSSSMYLTRSWRRKQQLHCVGGTIWHQFVMDQIALYLVGLDEEAGRQEVCNFSIYFDSVLRVCSSVERRRRRKDRRKGTWENILVIPPRQREGRSHPTLH